MVNMLNIHPYSFAFTYQTIMKKVLIAIIGVAVCSMNVNAQLISNLIKKGKDSKYTVIRELPEGDPYLVKSDGYTLPMHSAYVGKIVFSDQKLSLDATKESLFKNSFNVEDAIYGRIFIKEPLMNYMCYTVNTPPTKATERHNSNGEYCVKYYIDGQLVPNSVMDRGNNSGQYQGRTTWQFFPAARGEDAKYNNTYFIEKMNGLSEGTHTIKMEVYAGDWNNYETPEPVAVGEFTLTKKAGASMKTGVSWASYKEGIVDAELNKQALTVINEYAGSQGWKETFKATKIASKDWSIDTDKYTGAILRRTLSFYAFATWPDGHCTVQTFLLSQTYQGGGNYSKVLQYRAIGNQDKVDCQ